VEASRFVQVVVRSPIGPTRSKPRSAQSTLVTSSLEQTFHYSVPPDLQGRIQPGHLIWVPFGARQLPGLVTSLSDASPIEETRDVLALIDPVPVLTPYQIELMHWISRYYHTPLHVVAWAMFPPGISWQSETILHLAEEPTSPPSQSEAVILELLRQRGSLGLDQIEGLVKIRSWRSTVNRLQAKGWVRRELRIRGPQVRPKIEKVMILSGLPADADIESLARAPKQKAALIALRRHAEMHSIPMPWEISLDEMGKLGVSPATTATLARRNWLAVEEREVRRDPLAGREFVTTESPRLTQDQDAAWRTIAAALEGAKSHVFLLHGVTGSGKTEVYLRALARVLEQGGQAIVLVPEISLTPQTIRRFAARFPGRLAVLHSKLSAGERYDEWRRIRQGQADIVVGPRSAIFSPLPRLRLVVLDEEHEWSYKQMEMPCYHARDVALKLGQLTEALVILGSATPDVTSYYQAAHGRFTLLQLPNRIMAHRGSVQQQTQDYHLADTQVHLKPVGQGYEDVRYMELPPVEIVDLRAELRAGNRGIFSRSLEDAMEIALCAGQQIILFLNRRGSSTVIMCRDCGHVLQCRGCDSSLTFHSDTGKLLCHYCNYETSVPKTCPNCGSARIRFFGLGTQKVEETVHERFPTARTLRWDRDVTGGKDAHEHILNRFIAHQADVLIGTQMIAKGLDLPLVTLVGVVSADTALHLPDFRSSERTFQLLSQVAGRAGRSILGGRVIIQTYSPQHPSIQAASRHDYGEFYERELEFRREHGYPPYSRLVRLLYSSISESRAQAEVERVRHVLDLAIAQRGIPNIEVIGPAPCFVPRIAGKHRWQIVLRGPEPAEPLSDLPLPMGWRVDVDPISLL